VAVSGDTAVVGDEGDGSFPAATNSPPNIYPENSGAAYVFTRIGGTWSQQAFLKASNANNMHGFGVSVAVSADTVVIGAFGPNQSGSLSGAAYVFTRSLGTWSEQAFLKIIGNDGAGGGGAYFGGSVAVSGDTAVIGASGANTITTGGNSTPNESSVRSGAAYIFDVPAPAPAVAITAVSPDARTTPVTTMNITFSAPVQNFDLSDLTLTRDDGSNLIDGSFSLATADSTFYILTIPAATTTLGGTYRLSIQVSDIVDLSGIPLVFGGEEQWLTLPPNQDTDGDGMNDVSELNMAALGFDWQVSQPGLVSTYQNNANGAGYYSLAQVQALHSGTPLIQRNPLTGKFKLTMDWKKSTNLTNFFDFPAPAGSAVSINPAGDIEFEFTSPDDAAFFRLGSE
jgi:hypothetical protein